MDDPTRDRVRLHRSVSAMLADIEAKLALATKISAAVFVVLALIMIFVG